MCCENPAEFDEPLTACPICTSARIGRYDRDYMGRLIFRCGACGLKFLNPPYTDTYLAGFYARYISLDTAETPDRIARRTAAKADCLRLIDRYAVPGRLLSIGCGDGLELELARRHGWETEGYDVDPATTARVSQRVGVPVHCGELLDLKLPADRFDCVFLDQVLEHPKNPRAYLIEIRRILKPGGLLFVGCPNIMSLAKIGKTILGKLGLKRRRGRHYDTQKHLSYFSPRTLKNILRRHFHFEVLAVQGDPLHGAGPPVAAAGRIGKMLICLRRRFPLLESNFYILARKSPSTPCDPPSRGVAARPRSSGNRTAGLPDC